MDQLTGLPTHKDLAARPADFLGAGEDVCGILLDIDGFIWVNSQRGHAQGDAVLTQLGQWLRRRSHELAGRALRIAGDEFLVLLPGRGLPDALSTAHTLVAECSALRIPYSRPGETRDFLSLSAVAFVATSDLADRLAELQEQGARRLYEMETAEGRNHSIVAQLRP